MQITAAMVKELRERTGAGMMECKKALTEAGGDMEAAIEAMRKSGAAKADKKAGRVAAEGVIITRVSNDGKHVAIVEINSETDFVAKDDNFLEFANQVADLIIEKHPADLEELKNLPLGDGTVEEARQALVAKIGENIQIRRFLIIDVEGGNVGTYLHGSRIGVVVDIEGGDEDLARDIAMHIAASKPMCVSEEDVPEDVLAKEKEILVAQAQDSGKPAEIIEKMVQGRLRKFLGEITLVGQPFVKDPDQTVGKLLDKAGATVKSFARYEVGEGIEKKQENFAEEVMAQVQGND
ncbi:MAG: elongation factor Ts [Gammaproteobacteria bacterium]|nr:MAG: elongation factor Ts [Gammaproteobacteria bacterium]